jgi:hypothetical protein
MEDRSLVFSEWESSLTTIMNAPRESVRAISYLKAWRTKAEPVWLQCDDDNSYVVKGLQAGRQITNDRIVAHVGRSLGAPVGKPKLVEISTELVKVEPRLGHLPPGLAHGTLWIPDCRDSWELLGTGEQENRGRYALLSALFGWVINHDPQFLCRKHPPRLVYSVDHGHCFAGGPDWTVESLKASPEMNSEMSLELALLAGFTSCHFRVGEFQQMLRSLKDVGEQAIFLAVASVPEEWGITMEERVVLVEYLVLRRQGLLSVLSRLSSEPG